MASTVSKIAALWYKIHATHHLHQSAPSCMLVPDLQISYIVICSTLFASVCYHTIYTWYDDLNLSVLALYPRYKPTHM